MEVQQPHTTHITQKVRHTSKCAAIAQQVRLIKPKNKNYGAGWENQNLLQRIIWALYKTTVFPECPVASC